MVSSTSVEKQLKQIHFNNTVWNRAEALELHNILMPDEEIYECVNGTYEGGIALLCATNLRLLLVDKKPFKFLNVEDLRFDMINEIDYSHRLIGARINIATGTKNLRFMSYNQDRLRKLIGHVQHCMAAVKQEQSKSAISQQQHLEQINQQLQTYLLAQQMQQEELRRQIENARNAHDDLASIQAPEPIKPSPELSDYLFAQRLLSQYESEKNATQEPKEEAAAVPFQVESEKTTTEEHHDAGPQLTDLYAAGMQEIFGKQVNGTAPGMTGQTAPPSMTNPLEINPLKVAYSKLPMVLRSRAFTRHMKRQQAQAAATKAANTQTAGAS